MPRSHIAIIGARVPGIPEVALATRRPAAGHRLPSALLANALLANAPLADAFEIEPARQCPRRGAGIMVFSSQSQR